MAHTRSEVTLETPAVRVVTPWRWSVIDGQPVPIPPTRSEVAAWRNRLSRDAWCVEYGEVE